MFAHEQNEPSIVKEAGDIHSLISEMILILNKYFHHKYVAKLTQHYNDENKDFWVQGYAPPR